MTDKCAPIDPQIDELRSLLERTARQHKYNFLHPKVLRLSKKLDHLIIKLMKKQRKLAPASF